MSRFKVLLLVVTLLLATGYASAEKVTIQLLWPEYTEEKVRFGEYIVQAFEAKYPDISVEMIRTKNPNQDLTIMAAAGVAPDVGWMGQGWKGLKDLWLPLDAYIARDSAESAISDYVPTLWESYKIGGKHYGLPLGFTATVLYMNLDLFATAGLKEPDQDWDWDTMVSYAKKLTLSRQGETPYQWGLDLIHGGDYWPLLYYDGPFWNADETKARFNTTARVQMLAARRELGFGHNVQPSVAQIAAQGTSQPAFLNSITAIYAGGSWALEPVRLNNKFDWDIIPFPSREIGGQTYRGTAIWPEEMYISSQTKNPEAAWQFIKFATSRDLLQWAAREGHIIPSRISVGGSRDFLRANPRPKHIEAFIQSGQMGTVLLDHPVGTKMMQQIQPLINRCVHQESNPMPAASAAEEINRIIQQMLDEYNQSM